ncbi:MAG: YqhA family protein [Synergistetes bacterium]|nr:YqhA family protein [Synergistota bacterium]MCX8128056.1 YqhA family protein [Synergistota bacterium]MDW8193094.1 YqhA family protein [Synergistota bacterium]
MKAIKDIVWWVFVNVRLITIISVVFSVIGAFFVYIMGALYIFKVIFSHMRAEEIPPLKLLTADLLIALDLFLCGSLFIIFSYGTYDLFIRKTSVENVMDSATCGPIWLSIKNVEDLKSYLLGYILIMLSVTFLKQAVAVDYTSPVSLFLFAGGIFLLGLTYYFAHKR